MHEKTIVLLLNICKVSSNRPIERFNPIRDMITSNETTKQVTLAITITVKTSKYNIVLNGSNAAMAKQAKLRQSVRKLWLMHTIRIVIPQCYQERLPLKEDN